MNKKAGNMKISILSLQWGFIERIKSIEYIGHESIKVKEAWYINTSCLWKHNHLKTLKNNKANATPFKEKFKEGLTIWETYIGMILLAKEIEE